MVICAVCVKLTKIKIVLDFTGYYRNMINIIIALTFVIVILLGRKIRREIEESTKVKIVDIYKCGKVFRYIKYGTPEQELISVSTAPYTFLEY